MVSLFKHCPSCTSDKTNWEGNKFSCKNCGFIFFQNVAAAVCVLIEREGKYLFTRRAQEPFKGTLDLPGGFIDPYETAEIGVKREVKEELGLDLEDIKYITSEPNQYPYKDVLYHTCDMLFTAKTEQKYFDLQKNEISSVEWRAPKELNLNEIGLPSIKKLIKLHFEISIS